MSRSHQKNQIISPELDLKSVTLLATEYLSSIFLLLLYYYSDGGTEEIIVQYLISYDLKGVPIFPPAMSEELIDTDDHLPQAGMLVHYVPCLPHHSKGRGAKMLVGDCI